MIRLAAEIAGEDPFDFVIASTIMHARAVLGEREVIEVMPADMARIARMLDATAQPVLALQAVAARHRDVFGT